MLSAARGNLEVSPGATATADGAGVCSKCGIRNVPRLLGVW